MNNSFIAIENVLVEKKVDTTPILHQRQTELKAIIEAIIRLADNPDWLLLQNKVWNGVVESLKKERDSEVVKQPLNGPKIHSLNGQIKWAEKYANILPLADIYKLELQNIRKILNAKSND